MFVFVWINSVVCLFVFVCLLAFVCFFFVLFLRAFFYIYNFFFILREPFVFQRKQNKGTDTVVGFNSLLRHMPSLPA